MAWSSSSVAVASSYPYHFSPSSRTTTAFPQNNQRPCLLHFFFFVILRFPIRSCLSNFFFHGIQWGTFIRNGIPAAASTTKVQLYTHSGAAAETQCLYVVPEWEEEWALHFIFIILHWCWAHSWSSYSSSLSAKDHVQRHIIISCVYSSALCELLRHTESEPPSAKPKGNHNNSVPTSQI